MLTSCDRSAQNMSESPLDDISPGSGLMDKWPDEGPELLWTYEGLGKGYGGPAVTNEGIFINGEDNGNSYTLKLDHKGKLCWRSSNGKEFTGIDYTASYPGTRSAPTVVEGHVYASSGMGQLSCFDAHNGALIWTSDLITEFNGNLGDFGYSESPVLDQKRIYCFPGGSIHNIVALDRMTGDLAWSAPVNQDYFSYSTPVLVDLPEREVLIGTSRNYIHVLDRKDGQLLSNYTLEDIRYGYEHCNSVVFLDEHVYFVASEKHGQGTVKLLLSSNGKSLKEVWRNNKLTNIFGGFVIVKNRLFSTLESRKLVGLDINNGRIKSSVRAVSGSIVYADAKLFIYGHNGMVQLFKLDQGKPELTSEFRIREGSGHHFSFPVIADGVMYIRRGHVLMAYAIKD